MIRVSVSALKNGLSGHLRQVRAGQSIIVCNRNVPVARIDRIATSRADSERVMRLRAEGVTCPPARPLTARLRAKLLQQLPARARLLEALLAERAEDR